MKGTELAQKIQQHPDLKKKPKIILVSASSQEEIEKQTAGEWEGTLLSKPVTPSVLYDSMISMFSDQTSNFAKTSQKKVIDSDHMKRVAGAYVLLVEDNAINQELALELLNNAGILTQVANNGREALDMLQKETFDGILMDVEMPEMDGLTATCEIRKQKKFKDLPLSP